MRAPPPVEFKSALARAWRTALSLLVGASVAVPLAWSLPFLAARWGGGQPDALFEALGNPLVQGGLAAWVVAMAVAAFWLASKRAAASERTLRWDGQDWVLAGGALAGQPEGGDRHRAHPGGQRGLDGWIAERLEQGVGLAAAPMGGGVGQAPGDRHGHGRADELLQGRAPGAAERTRVLDGRRRAHRSPDRKAARDGQILRNTRVPFVPPKPKLFFTATSIFIGRAVLAQ